MTIKNKLQNKKSQVMNQTQAQILIAMTRRKSKKKEILMPKRNLIQRKMPLTQEQM
jgi:hypothetical protein